MINKFLFKQVKLHKTILQTLTTFVLPKASKNLFQNIFTEELSYLVNLFKNNKFEIKVAGGAVRDLLMEIIPHDIDFATDATPSEMKELFLRNGIRLINTNGESHGTVTPRINDKANFEITTLRYDKVTDGRRAEVVFTKDWKIDAERRDLTINSMFLDMNGIVYDYCRGKEDIDRRNVRFVGDPCLRIQEDYLRILRYFRFYGRIALDPHDHLTDTINVIRSYGAGLERVSGERIWMELRMILCGNFAPEIMEKMKCCEILPYLGLPENPTFSELKNRFSILKQNNCHPAIILSTIINDKSQLAVAFDRLKFSKEDLAYLLFMINNRDLLANIVIENSNDDHILNYCKNRYVMHIGDPPQIKFRLCFIEYFKYINRLDLMKEFDEWRAPVFPIRAEILSRKWQIKGKKLEAAIQFLKQKWKDSNFAEINEGFINDNKLKDEFMKLEDTSK